MYLDMTVNIMELVFATLGAILIIFGWFVPYRQSVKSLKHKQEFDSKLLCARWEKEMVDKQISQFYGPISELLREQKLRFHLILRQLGRETVFQIGQEKITDLPEDEQKIWIHFINTYNIPIHSKIVEIIQDNQHLIYKSEMPDAFGLYMEYVLGWELLDNQKRNGVPNFYEYYYRYNFPVSFPQYIERTLDKLLKKQNELMQIYKAIS